MDRSSWPALRAAGVVAAGVLVVAGIAFAQRGEGAAPAAPSVEAARPSPTIAGPSSTATSSSPGAAAIPTASQPTPAETSAVVPATVRAPAPATAAAVPVVAPNPTSTPAAAAIPVSDIPKYTDVAVLALAADAVLPSGRTFRECVELPPSHEKWPTPVHLYYEGKGRWLVETHVSEVQVVFDEATASFTPRNFAPLNPACR